MAAVLFAPAAPELPSTPEAGQGGAPWAGIDIKFCSGPAKDQALRRLSSQIAGRGLGVDLVDWKFTHLPPD